MLKESKKFTLDEKIVSIICLFDNKSKINTEEIGNLQNNYKFWCDIPDSLLAILKNKLSETTVRDRLANATTNTVAKLKQQIYNRYNGIKVPILNKFNPAMFKHSVRIFPSTVTEELERRNSLRGLNSTSNSNTIKKKLSFDMDKFDELEKKLDKLASDPKTNPNVDDIIKYYSFEGDTVLNSIARGKYSLSKSNVKALVTRDVEELKNKYEIDEDVLVEKVLELAKLREHILSGNNRPSDTDTVYRGMGIHNFIKLIGFSPKEYTDMDSMLIDLVKTSKGKIFSDSAISSTSKDLSVAKDFAYESTDRYSLSHSKDPIFKTIVPVILEINLKKCKKASDISSISLCDDESEVLLSQGQKLKITKLEHKGTIFYVYVDAI